MKNTVSATDLKSRIQGWGADLVGTAGVQGIPLSPLLHPNRVLEGAYSAIVFGVAGLTGAIDSSNPRIGAATVIAVDTELRRIAYTTVRFLEGCGLRAAIAGPVPPMEMSRETKGLIPDFPIKVAAVAAGLGVRGKSGLVLTPRWGPRVRLSAVVTDAVLDKDEPLNTDLCGDCHLCIESCPAGAISGVGTDSIKCVTHLEPYGVRRTVRFLSELLSKPDEQKAVMLRDPFLWGLHQTLSQGLYYNCFECLRVCPVGR